MPFASVSKTAAPSAVRCAAARRAESAGGREAKLSLTCGAGYGTGGIR